MVRPLFLFFAPLCPGAGTGFVPQAGVLLDCSLEDWVFFVLALHLDLVCQNFPVWECGFSPLLGGFCLHVLLISFNAR